MLRHRRRSSGGGRTARSISRQCSPRAANDELARKLLWRTEQALARPRLAWYSPACSTCARATPGLALESLDKLAQLQPDNPNAQLLLARGMFADGDYRGVTEDFAAAAAQPMLRLTC